LQVRDKFTGKLAVKSQSAKDYSVGV